LPWTPADARLDVADGVMGEVPAAGLLQLLFVMRAEPVTCAHSTFAG
jgi:hypothetical protein